MEDRGYLVVYLIFIDFKGYVFVEQQYIIYKEFLVVNDIFNYFNFVKKNLCNSFSDRMVQRFYKFNISFVGDLMNFVYGSYCFKYRLVRILGINVFVGIVNEICDFLVFCVCSMVDWFCFNCY